MGGVNRPRGGVAKSLEKIGCKGVTVRATFAVRCRAIHDSRKVPLLNLRDREEANMPAAAEKLLAPKPQQPPRRGGGVDFIACRPMLLENRGTVVTLWSSIGGKS